MGPTRLELVSYRLRAGCNSRYTKDPEYPDYLLPTGMEAQTHFKDLFLFFLESGANPNFAISLILLYQKYF